MRRKQPRRGAQLQNGRLRRTPRNKARPNYWALFCWFLMSLCISGGVAYVLATPYLAIKEVKIYGVKLADASAVEAAGKHALKQNVLLLNKTPIKDEIRRLPEVAQVKMGRRFPDRVWIRVWERKPSAILTDGRRFCMIESNGFMFHLANGPVRGVTLIQVAGGCPMKPGETVSVPSVASALEVLNQAKKQGLKLSKISVDRLGDMCLNMGSAFYVKLGQPDDIARKMSLLRRALAYKPALARDAEYIDITVPSAPAWRPRAIAQAASSGG